MAGRMVRSVSTCELRNAADGWAYARSTAGACTPPGCSVQALAHRGHPVNGQWVPPSNPKARTRQARAAGKGRKGSGTVLRLF